MSDKHSIRRSKVQRDFEEGPPREDEPGLGYRGGLDNEGAYGPVPGDPGSVPSGRKMVCPVPSCHFSRRLQQRGERLYCPSHHEELVPE